MEALVHAMLSNALVASLLALVPIGLGRMVRLPALVHGLWFVVLLKLITPPLLTVPILAVPLGVPMVADSSQMPSVSEVGVDASAKSVEKSRSLDTWMPSQSPDNPPSPGWVDLERDTLTLAPATDGIAEGYQDEPIRAEPAYAGGGVIGSFLERFSIDGSMLPRWELSFLVLTLGGGMVFWSLAFMRIVRLQRLLHDLRPAPLELQERALEISRSLGIRRAPSIWLAPGRVPPMLWALGGRSRVLVPLELWSTLDEDQETALLMHELAHLKRKDHWVRWLDLAVAGIYWWHPVVWWARRGLREAEEQCCDAWVVSAMPRRAKTYASALVATLEFVSGSPRAGAVAAVAAVSGRGHVSCLKRRLRMIVAARTPKGLGWAGQ